MDTTPQRRIREARETLDLLRRTHRKTTATQKHSRASMSSTPCTNALTVARPLPAGVHQRCIGGEDCSGAAGLPPARHGARKAAVLPLGGPRDRAARAAG